MLPYGHRRYYLGYLFFVPAQDQLLKGFHGCLIGLVRAGLAVELCDPMAIGIHSLGRPWTL